MQKPLPSFEQLKEMAKANPDALERLRQEHVQAAINAAPEQYRKRLEGLQFQIDGQRRIAKNPMSSCITISKMMHDSLHKLKTCIQGSEDEQPAESNKRSTAKIISLHI
ncbi:DUF3135 domain-containing protein [Bermanella marisrubri]|uniref:DUF3135 domain-containing protein n=1 Tax=Bermanella marisrubri TaxID=207949 RepID=Q1N013_9GAMM|nr:DUF3135 domain-containing protein [Bermanella marisrubri]EAT11550.1 hypothetical protein RED65_02729 [Oceanobacter sp. RED65] [Bermanella marisrubri]QIZ84985.1 DUF3135 domain-containing protein [Bermanella marisrubri]